MTRKSVRSTLRSLTAVLVLLLFDSSLTTASSDSPVIVPEPQEMRLLASPFLLTEQTVILLPQSPSGTDTHLARLFEEQISDRYGLTLRSKRVASADSGGSAIVMGTLENPLIKKLAQDRLINVGDIASRPEGYVLLVNARKVVIAGSSPVGAFYGLQSLRQLIKEDGQEALRISGVALRDWPAKPFRGIRLYLPGRDNIGFFKRFVRDFMALYKFNTLIIEVNACMRLERHPELNAGWVEFAKDLNYTQRYYPLGPNGEAQNSAHQDTADGDVLDKREVAEIVRYAREHKIEVIPEIPSLTHAYYLLTRYRELAENHDVEWPDTYCPSNPKVYPLLFDVMEEYIAVMRPKMVHIGHDEFFVPWGRCPRCKDSSPTDLYAQDVRKVHAFLAKRGIRTAMWGDHLLEVVRGKGFRNRVTKSGFSYNAPGGLSDKQVRELIPKDILILNWFWGRGESVDTLVASWGFRQIYGNFTPSIENYETRSQNPSIVGGAPSSWAATNEFNFGKDLLHNFIGCATLLWSGKNLDKTRFSTLLHEIMPGVRRNLSGRQSPSEDRNPVVPVSIESRFNVQLHRAITDIDPAALKSGLVTSRNYRFSLADPLIGNDAAAVGTEGDQTARFPREVRGIPIGEDVSSIVFLHAALAPSVNDMAYRLIWNFDDTAALLGWYEIMYDDGFSGNVPIRYGVNILEWNWGRALRPGTYCYLADPVGCGKEKGREVTFFAFEWVNRRFGKKVTEVHLKGTRNFQRAIDNQVIAANGVILKAVSVVKKRTDPAPVRASSQGARISRR